MNICTYGTTRIDFYIYKPTEVSDQNEIRFDKFDIKVGGSVFNTSSVLNVLKADVMYYTILGNDQLSVISNKSLNDLAIKYKSIESGNYQSAVTFIHLNSDGEKKMYSYDDLNSQCDVIDLLVGESNNFSAFYTSAYEITDTNESELADLINDFAIKGKKTYLDLTPLVYRIPKHIWFNILPNLNTLFGTSDEFDILLRILEFSSIEHLIKNFNIEKLLIKEGGDGSSYMDKSLVRKSFKTTYIKSDNLTGCGDAFNAGVLFGELNGWQIGKSIEYGMKLAFNVAKYGFDLYKIARNVDL